MRTYSDSAREVMTALRRAGFEEVSRRGSHVKPRHGEQRRTVIVPDHREIARGTMRSILRQAGLSPAQFEDLASQ